MYFPTELDLTSPRKAEAANSSNNLRCILKYLLASMAPRKACSDPEINNNAPPPHTEKIKRIRVMISEPFEDPVNIKSMDGEKPAAAFFPPYLNRCFLTHSVEQKSL